ncbi:alpha-amylase [Frankia sp. R43]|uniref:glycoside hydrolase family 13 protein n=1 Tax=Frankia sp. R43 TaxID=269536 RepID=UPI0006CA07D3|nr:glycoside hydrolase family 13 protein [Frankia sp. R43]KPM54792.1 alpha-amylase [Frankia sp. R43]
MDPVVTDRADAPTPTDGTSTKPGSGAGPGDGGGEPGSGAAQAPWWRDAVMYEVYIRSFADTDGDGVGDLEGIRGRLPDLADLGVDGIWISPFYRSPMADHGYDVADHTDVDPLFGTLDDLDALLRDAHTCGLKVIVDVVPNHSSEQHPAFQAALAAGPGSPERELYLFRDGRGPDGALPPNNWISVFGGPAWSRVPDGQWYLHLFAREQPDWNWRHPQVRAEHREILRFWLDRGVDGFRIDVSHGLVKDDALRDHPALATHPANPIAVPATPAADGHAGDREGHGEGDRGADGVGTGATGAAGAAGAVPTPETGFRELFEPYSWDQDGVHEIYREWRAILDDYDRRDGRDRVLVGETWVADPERLARYVRPDELHLTFTFSLLYAPFSAPAWRSAIDAARAATAAVGAVPTWVLANHDVIRPVSRYGGGATGLRRARAALLAMLALPGTAYLYQGDELGLPQVDVPPDRRRDPVWERSGHTSPGRDGTRIPMPWSGQSPPYGFTADEVEPWLPQPPDWGALTAAAQSEDPLSTRVLVHGALALRRALPFLGSSAGPDEAQPGFRWLADLPVDCLAFDRTAPPARTPPPAHTAPPAGTAPPGDTAPPGRTAPPDDTPPPAAGAHPLGSALTCVMSTDEEVRLALAGRLVLASSPVSYDGATLVLPPATTVWVVPRSG